MAACPRQRQRDLAASLLGIGVASILIVVGRGLSTPRQPTPGIDVAVSEDPGGPPPPISSARVDVDAIDWYFFDHEGERSLVPALAFVYQLEGHHSNPTGLCVFSDGVVVQWVESFDRHTRLEGLRGMDWLWLAAALHVVQEAARSDPEVRLYREVAIGKMSNSFGGYWVSRIAWRTNDGLRCIVWRGGAKSEQYRDTLRAFLALVERLAR